MKRHKFLDSSVPAEPPEMEQAEVVHREYGHLDKANLPEGVVFFIEPSVLEALFSVEYTERAIKRWNTPGMLESVIEDLCLCAEEGKATWAGSGTQADPYTVQVVEREA